MPRLRKEFGEDRVPYAMILGIDALREENRVQYLAKGKIFCGFEKEKAQKNAPKLALLEEFFSTSDITFSGARRYSKGDMVQIHDKCWP